MALILKSPEAQDLRPRITVFGVGGAGGNAVNNMIEKALEGAEFVVANTDAQALQQSRSTRKLQLGAQVTQGLGAGAKPGVGAQAAEESLEEIVDCLAGSHMCFITAGMGGGTGTGAAPVIARAAREMGILTVGVVTKPFQFEGARRMAQAESGIDQLQQVVDTLIIIPNQNLFRIANERTTFAEAFMMADDVLYQGVKGVTDLMVRPGLINLDFADVRSVMDEMGKAMMGTGEASGETRAVDAAEKAIANPLLDEVSLKGARGVLINITGGYDLTLFELDEAANRIRAEVDPEANIIVGSTLDPEMSGAMRVSVVATGIDVAMTGRADAPTHESAAQSAQQGAPLRQPEPRVAMAQAPAARIATHQPAAAQPAPRPVPQPAPRPAAAANLFAVGEDAVDQLAPEVLFDLDEASIARPVERELKRDHPFVAPAPDAGEAPRAARPQPAQVSAQRAAPAPDEDEEPRARFGFNNLITRMTGGGREKELPSFIAKPGARREPTPGAARHEPARHEPARPARDEEDMRMEVPAFLRRQAN